MTQEPKPIDLTTIQSLASELGFALAGVCRAEPSQYAAFIRQWLEDGRHGEMDYLARHVEQRIDPRVLLPGARSVICLADRYGAGAKGQEPTTESQESKVRGQGSITSGKIARYAWGRDYHKVIKKRLFKLADKLAGRFPGQIFKSAVDTAPVLEREHARRAGMGWVGKHTLLIHPRLGSYLLLGEIVTTLAVDTAEPHNDTNTATQGTGATQQVEQLPRADVIPGAGMDHCGNCTRCLDACPTQCITPYQLEADRCISYLTIEHRSLIDPLLHEAMGDWLAGCDVCQEVCPYNAPLRIERFAPAPIGEAYQAGHLAGGLDLLAVLNWTTVDYQENFRGSALKRIKPNMLKRNALIAAGNALMQNDDPALLDRIETLARDESAPELVRLTAHQTLDRLGCAGRRDSKRRVNDPV